MPTILLKDKQGNPKGYNDVNKLVVKDINGKSVAYNQGGGYELRYTTDKYIRGKQVSQEDFDALTQAYDEVDSLVMACYVVNDQEICVPAYVIPKTGNSITILAQKGVTTTGADRWFATLTVNSKNRYVMQSNANEYGKAGSEREIYYKIYRIL